MYILFHHYNKFNYQIIFINLLYYNIWQTNTLITGDMLTNINFKCQQNFTESIAK